MTPADERRQELIRQAEADHQRAIEFTARLIGLRTGVQAFAGTVWAAAVSIGASLGLAATYFVGAALCAMLAALDLRYSQQQGALRRASRRYEQALSAHYKFIRRKSGKAQAEQALETALRQIEIGQTYLFSPVPSPSGVGKGQRLRAWVKRGKEGFDLRVGLVIALAASSFIFGTVSSWGGSEDRTCIRTDGGVVELDSRLLSDIDLNKGEFAVVDCS